MNRNRDIERVLDAWFVEGPSVMPDRLLLAVFDQVDRVPQRRLSRLTLRLSEMTPRLRLLAAAAAAIVIAVVGFALIDRAPLNNVGPSHSPTAAPSFGPTFDPTLPGAILGRWNGSSRDVPGMQAGAGTSILFDAGTIEFAQANQLARPRFASAAAAVGENLLEVTTIEEDSYCTVGDVGRYAWQRSVGGKTLDVTVEADDCANRENAFVGAWRFADCPVADNGCLGPLEGGTYESQYFDPFVGPAELWLPRYGALTYTAPAGWSNDADWPGSFALTPSATPEAAIFLFADVVAAATDAPCGEDRAPGIGETADDLAAWLATLADVVAAPPTAMKVGGRDAWRVDLSLAPGYAATCPFSEGEPYLGLLVDRPTEAGFAWGLRGEAQVRLYLVDLGDDRALMISIEAPTQASFDAVVNEATAIVESFVLQP